MNSIQHCATTEQLGQICERRPTAKDQGLDPLHRGLLDLDKATQAMATEQQADVAGVHRYKLKPPTFNGDIAQYEEWKYKFQAYMGLQHSDHEKLMRSTDNATTTITELDLETAASSQEEGNKWKQLAQEMKYILTNVTSGGAATVCRQYQHETGYEILRQLNRRYSIPVGTRSMGYLTKLLKPTFDTHNFEESFAHWEYEVTKFERDNSMTLPDQVKIAVLLNETTGPLQQHLQLLAGTNQTYAAIRTTITEYYRATTAFSRMQASQAPSSAVGTSYSGGTGPMDIGAIGKSKGYKGKGYSKGKGYGNKGKAGKGHGKGYKGSSKGKYKSKGPVGKYGQGYSGKGWQQQHTHTHGPERKRTRQAEEQECHQHMLQMWTRRTLCKGLQSGSVQPHRHFDISA